MKPDDEIIQKINEVKTLDELKVLFFEANALDKYVYGCLFIEKACELGKNMGQPDTH